MRRNLLQVTNGPKVQLPPTSFLILAWLKFCLLFDFTGLILDFYLGDAAE